MNVKHMSQRLFFLIFRFFPCCLIVTAIAIAKPALESLQASADSLECYCPSCPEDLLPAAGFQALGRIKVEIAGAVKKPGIYELDLGQRRADLLTAAGGLDQEASMAFMVKTFNLSTVLSDGEKIYIPYVWEEDWQLTNKMATNVPAGSPTEATNNNTANPVSSLISINNASAKELESLAGIGEKRASDIISNRPYVSLNELVSKEVLTQSLFDSIKEFVSL